MCSFILNTEFTFNSIFIWNYCSLKSTCKVALDEPPLSSNRPDSPAAGGEKPLHSTSGLLGLRRVNMAEKAPWSNKKDDYELRDVIGEYLFLIHF